MEFLPFCGDGPSIRAVSDCATHKIRDKEVCQWDEEWSSEEGLPITRPMMAGNAQNRSKYSKMGKVDAS